MLKIHQIPPLNPIQPITRWDRLISLQPIVKRGLPHPKSLERDRLIPLRLQTKCTETKPRFYPTRIAAALVSRLTIVNYHMVLIENEAFFMTLYKGEKGL